MSFLGHRCQYHAWLCAALPVKPEYHIIPSFYREDLAKPCSGPARRLVPRPVTALSCESCKPHPDADGLAPSNAAGTCAVRPPPYQSRTASARAPASHASYDATPIPLSSPAPGYANPRLRRTALTVRPGAHFARQVYRAETHDGKMLAIKVQRPQLLRQVRSERCRTHFHAPLLLAPCRLLSLQPRQPAAPGTHAAAAERVTRMRRR